MSEKISLGARIRDVVMWPTAQLGRLAEHAIKWIRGESTSPTGERGVELEETIASKTGRLWQEFLLERRAGIQRDPWSPEQSGRINELVLAVRVDGIRRCRDLTETEGQLKGNKTLSPSLKQAFLEKLNELGFGEGIKAITVLDIGGVGPTAFVDSQKEFIKMMNRLKEAPRLRSFLVAEYARKVAVRGLSLSEETLKAIPGIAAAVEQAKKESGL